MSVDDTGTEEDRDLFRLLELAKIDTGVSLTQLTKLNLSNCGLSSLPLVLAESLPSLTILFLSGNHFCEMPKIIGDCRQLQMVAFKDNKMATIHADALQPQLRWLILTGNSIKKLPDTIGRCNLLQKLMLSGNQLEELPESMGANCHQLELVRLASNQLKEPPMALLSLPSLCWIALSDNPFLAHVHDAHVGPVLPILLELDHRVDEGIVLGRGAGGVTRKIMYQGKFVAMKDYGGAMTSDGLPSHERQLACAAAGALDDCRGLIQVLGETPKGSLVMEYLDRFVALAGPPSMESCSRDVYVDESVRLTVEQGEKLVTCLLEVLTKLHAIGICHGDFYAHNILIHEDDPADVRLSDFGAAFFYDKNELYGKRLEQIELRAFAVLVCEVNALLMDGPKELYTELTTVCTNDDSSFDSVHVWWKQRQLAGMAQAFVVDSE